MDELEEQQEPADADGCAVTLIAGPFRDAGCLRRFVEAVMALPGVRSAGIVALEQRTLTLMLQDAGATPLRERLQALAEFPFVVASDEPDSLEIRFGDEREEPSQQ